MLPNNGITLKNGIKVKTHPTHTYALVVERSSIRGYTDKLEAMKQVVYKIIYTERYQYVIYNWNYGIELKDLFGKPKNYVRSESKRRITEALMADDRIIGVRGFAFSDPKRHTIAAKFTVDTVFGSVEAERVVNY